MPNSDYFKGMMRQLNQNLKMTSQRGNAAIFVPGLILLLLGFAVVRFPQLAIALVSAMLIFFGVLVLTLGWKFYKLKQALEQSMKNGTGLNDAGIQGFTQQSQNGPFQVSSRSFFWSNMGGANRPTHHQIDEDTIEVLDAEDSTPSSKRSSTTYH